jgi:glutathione synthase/RimK-type ligase-like ATP-grasp enzyme
MHYKGSQPVGSLTNYCQELSHYATKEGMLVIVFSIQDVNFQNNKVSGWAYQNHKWTKLATPLPNIIYNRIGSRKAEANENYEQFLLKIKAHDIILFNESFLNKWEVHQSLKSFSSLADLQPLTKYFLGPEPLFDLLALFPAIYLKPIHGSMGRGIYKVSKVNATLYYCQYSTPNGTVNKHFSSIQQLYFYLKPRIEKKGYIIQQGLELLTYHQRPIDFRLLMQKNRYGKWSITSIVGRIGKKNHIVSNLASGGTLSTPYHILNHSIMHRRFIGQIKKMREVALEITEKIDEKSPGEYGELGIDMAIDQSGKLWLLEINSKPSKNDGSFTPSTQTRPSIIKLVEYAIYRCHQD